MGKGRQLDIFQPSLNPVSRLKAAMRLAIKEGRWSREQVVERMNEAAAIEGLSNGRGQRLTVAALDGWMAESKGNMIPVGLLPLFCWAAENMGPLKVLAACLEGEVIGPEEKKLLEWARLEQEGRKLARRKKRLAEEIGAE